MIAWFGSPARIEQRRAGAGNQRLFARPTLDPRPSHAADDGSIRAEGEKRILAGRLRASHRWRRRRGDHVVHRTSGCEYIVRPISDGIAAAGAREERRAVGAARRGEASHAAFYRSLQSSRPKLASVVADEIVLLGATMDIQFYHGR